MAGFDLYNKTQIGDATKFKRPYQTISTGPFDGPNTLTIFEELITQLSDGSFVRSEVDTPEIKVTIENPNEVFNVVDPTTGVVLTTMTFAQLKVQMYSLYLHLAAARDQAAA